MKIEPRLIVCNTDLEKKNDDFGNARRVCQNTVNTLTLKAEVRNLKAKVSNLEESNCLIFESS